MNTSAKDYTIENLLWFRKYFPNVYHQLRNRQFDTSQVRITTSKNLQANMEVNLNDVWQPIYSRYNPEQEAIRWAQQLQLDADEVILVGMGCGYHLKALLEYYPKVHVHVFEPKEQLILAGLQVGLFFELFAERIRSIEVVPSYHEISSLEELASRFFQPIISQILHQRVEILFVPSYQRLFEKEISVITEMFKKLVLQQQHELQVTVGFEKMWTLNALKNLRYTLKSPSAGILKEKVAGKPLIIVSSGPSLEKEVEVLKQYRNHAFILAAGSSVNGLIHQGILPHAVISYDPAPENKKVFDLLATYDVQIPFIFGTTIYYGILSEYEFDRLFHVVITQDTVTPHIFQCIGIQPELVLSDAPSIAIVALQLAIWWEANPIIFVGQDLSFPNNKYYAAGVSHLGDRHITEEKKDDYFMVEKVGGGTVLTSKSLNLMRENMENVIKQVSFGSHSRVFINTSTEGARIHGTTEMPLVEALRRYGCSGLDVETWFLERTYNTDTDLVNRGLNCLQKLFEKQQELNDLFEELAHINRRIQQNARNNQLQKMFHRLDDLMVQISKHILYQIVYHPMMRTKVNLYKRMANQVRHQDASIEKACFISERLQDLIDTYFQIHHQLNKHGIFS